MPPSMLLSGEGGVVAGREWGDAALPPLAEGELAAMPMEELTKRWGFHGSTETRPRHFFHVFFL